MKIRLIPKYPKSAIITITSMMVALVALTTFMIQIYIPATGGYFNVGETIIYISSILFGPIIGGIAGGLGAAIADIIGPYAIYAPGTLVIKFCEGFVIGLLCYNINPEKHKKYWKYSGIGIGIIIGLLITYFGINFYSSEWVFEIVNLGSISITLSMVIWITIAIISSLLIIITSLKISQDTNLFIISSLIGGLIMVLGYFLYEFFILYALLNIEILAIIEIPFNLGQVIIGIIIATPVAKAIKKYITSLNIDYTSHDKSIN